ncbi:MAG TPA: hypothetical protein DC000_10385 [Clostridiales bacterium]|nr:hypothetical protein [Clostridiales bacterium]
MRMLCISFAWLFIIILIWALFYFLSIEKTIDFFDDELKKIYSSAINENYNEAQINVNKIQEQWKKTEKLWIYFVHQGEVDDISSSILKIDVYIKTENKSMILSEIEELKKLFRMVKGNESLSFENLF